jgi:integrase
MATAQKRGNSYKITSSNGYDSDGNQIRKHMTWTPEKGMSEKQIEKELERQKILFDEKCKQGKVLNGNIKFSEFADIWFEDFANKQLRIKTIDRYKTMMPRINAAIGHIRLDRLKPLQLMQFYSNLQEEGVRQDDKYNCKVNIGKILEKEKLTKVKAASMIGISTYTLNAACKGENVTFETANKLCTSFSLDIKKDFNKVARASSLSSKTILHHHRLISSILNTAVKWQIIYDNPCSRVKPPKVESKEAEYLDEELTTILLEKLEYEPIKYKVMIKLMLYTGFRRGEICGLVWDDVDFQNNTIKVARSSLYSPKKGVFEDETKNFSSVRTIKVSTSVIDMLTEYKAWQDELAEDLGNLWHNSNRLFTGDNGNPIHPDTITGWLHDFAVNNNLPSIGTRGLRHTNATLLIASGTPITTVSNRLGHANVTTTGKVYVHAIKSADAVAAETIENILTPNENNKKNKTG